MFGFHSVLIGEMVEAPTSTFLTGKAARHIVLQQLYGMNDTWSIQSLHNAEGIVSLV